MEIDKEFLEDIVDDIIFLHMKANQHLLTNDGVSVFLLKKMNPRYSDKTINEHINELIKLVEKE